MFCAEIYCIALFLTSWHRTHWTLHLFSNLCSYGTVHRIIRCKVHNSARHITQACDGTACGADTHKLMCILYSSCCRYSRQPVVVGRGQAFSTGTCHSLREGFSTKQGYLHREPVYIFSTQSRGKGRWPFPQTCNIDLLSKREKVKGTVTWY